MFGVSEYQLPAKVPAYLRRLKTEYASDDPKLAEVLGAARIEIVEAAGHDNWNGGTALHDVRLFLPPEVIGHIKVKDQSSVASKICSDLNACAMAFSNEGFQQVVLEIEDPEDPAYQRARPLTTTQGALTDTSGIWRPGHIRLFISHRDKRKAAAHELADALETYGISAFVAHDTIQPMTTWKDEILKGLNTMDVMLAIVTDDFDQSYWTQQEVGFALGRGINVIPLKVGVKDPPGFISSTQALRGKLDALASSAPEIYDVLANKLGNKSRLQGALVSAFCEAPSFPEAIERFNRLEKLVVSLTDDEYVEIASAFLSNSQLHGSIYLTNHNERLKRFLTKATGLRTNISDKVITQPDRDHLV